MTERESGEKAAEKGVVWDKEIDVPEKWIQFVDNNVLASEPFGACYRRPRHDP